MDKTLEFTLLLDFYGELLTDKQREILGAYYLYDLSLAEIGQQHEVSRQAVHDIIKRTEKKLVDYETKLKLVENHLNNIEGGGKYGV